MLFNKMYTIQAHNNNSSLQNCYLRSPIKYSAMLSIAFENILLQEANKHS